jgi:repressor LexA
MTPASELPPTFSQLEVLDYIKRFQRNNQCSPTKREIADHFGWASSNAAVTHCFALAEKGFIKLVPGRSRGIQLTDKAAA